MSTIKINHLRDLLTNRDDLRTLLETSEAAVGREASSLRKQIAEGETTGDALKDWTLFHYGAEYLAMNSSVRAVHNCLKGKKGQAVVFYDRCQTSPVLNLSDAKIIHAVDISFKALVGVLSTPEGLSTFRDDDGLHLTVALSDQRAYYLHRNKRKTFKSKVTGEPVILDDFIVPDLRKHQNEHTKVIEVYNYCFKSTPDGRYVGIKVSSSSGILYTLQDNLSYLNMETPPEVKSFLGL